MIAGKPREGEKTDIIPAEAGIRFATSPLDPRLRGDDGFGTEGDHRATPGERIAAEALALIGTPFRLRGRDVRTGIDCVGLILIAFGRAGVSVSEPPAYQLRGTGRERAEALLWGSGLMPAEREAPGDIVLVESGPLQLHLMIRASAGHVHAHAGLGRVVLMPAPAPWPVLGIWRME